MMPLPDEPRNQLEDAAFWSLPRDEPTPTYGLRTPIDRRAVYGRPVLGDRDPDDIEVPIRRASRDLRTAIRVLGERQHLKMHHEDRVRVNDGSWMEVVQPSREGLSNMADEGFMCRSVEGEKVRVVEPFNGSDRGPGTHDLPWMRRVDGWVSEGEVGCLEVEWDDEGRL